MKILVIGKKWVSKTGGNTYHTSTIYIDGEFLEKSKITYGYGNQFLETANDILLKHKIFENKVEICESQRNGNYNYESSYFSRKKDL